MGSGESGKEEVMPEKQKAGDRRQKRIGESLNGEWLNSDTVKW